MHKNLTVNLKSLGPRYGCKNGFLLRLPAKYEETLKQSKNLSIFAMKYDVSKAFPLLICIALETESLRTFKNTHMYNFLLHSTNLHCQINTHLRKTGKLDVLISQFWNQTEARCSCLSTSIPVVQLNHQLPINCIPIALHWEKKKTAHIQEQFT